MSRRVCRHRCSNRPEKVGLPEFALRLAQSFASRDGVIQNQVFVRASSFTGRAIERLPVQHRGVVRIRIPSVREPTPVAGHDSGKLEVLGTEDVSGWWRKKWYANVGPEQEVNVESMNRSSESHSIDHVLELVQVHRGIGSLNQARESLRATGILGVCHGLPERIFRGVVRRRRVRCEDRRRIRPELRCQCRFLDRSWVISPGKLRFTKVHPSSRLLPMMIGTRLKAPIS